MNNSAKPKLVAPAEQQSSTQPKPPATPKSAAKTKETALSSRRSLEVAKPRPKQALPVRPGTKTARVITMLQRRGGATIAELKKATGWQTHSVRGFLSGVLKAKLGLRLAVRDRDGKRSYFILSR